MSESTHRSRIAQDNPATHRVNQPGREEAVVRRGEHPIEHERPEEWGWHGEMGRTGRFLAVVPILFTLAYLVGNHTGRVENVWVLGTVAAMIGVLVWDHRRRKNLWRG